MLYSLELGRADASPPSRRLRAAMYTPQSISQSWSNKAISSGLTSFVFSIKERRGPSAAMMMGNPTPSGEFLRSIIEANNPICNNVKPRVTFLGRPMEFVQFGLLEHAMNSVPNFVGLWAGPDCLHFGHLVKAVLLDMVGAPEFELVAEVSL